MPTKLSLFKLDKERQPLIEHCQQLFLLTLYPWKGQATKRDQHR
jgi:hypothetical protein